MIKNTKSGIQGVIFSQVRSIYYSSQELNKDICYCYHSSFVLEPKATGKTRKTHKRSNSWNEKDKSPHFQMIWISPYTIWDYQFSYFSSPCWWCYCFYLLIDVLNCIVTVLISSFLNVFLFILPCSSFINAISSYLFGNIRFRPTPPQCLLMLRACFYFLWIPLSFTPPSFFWPVFFLLEASLICLVILNGSIYI